MLSRLVRTSIAAATQLSTKTAALATVAEPLTDEGNTVSSTSTNRTTAGGRDTLGRRLLALVYMKRSAVVTIRKWKEEGHVVRKYELNRIIRELRKLKRYKHALEVIYILVFIPMFPSWLKLWILDYLYHYYC